MKKTLIAVVFLPALALLVGSGESSGEAQGATLLLGDFAAIEGNSGSEQLVDYDAVTLSQTTAATVTFDYVLTDGTAFANVDYGAPFSGSVTIPPGTITGTIPVSVYGGSQFDSEPDETINLLISNVIGAGGPSPDATAVLTITNDDNLVSITSPAIAVDEGNMSETTVITMTATVTPMASFPVFVDVKSLDGTAGGSGGDYFSVDKTVTIPAFSSSQIYTATIKGDDLLEDREVFFIDPADARNAVIDPGSITIIIVDDDNRCGTTLDGFGGIQSTYGVTCNGGNTTESGDDVATLSNTPYFGFDIARDLEFARGGYYVLDGYGGLHADSGAQPLSPAPPYFGFDVAEDIEFLCDGSGALVLDSFGGLHAAGGAAAATPKPPYFGFDVARDMEITCPGLGVHVLDGFGGLHAGAGAPAISPATPYFGFDIAKDLELACTGTGAYVLDGFGGVHAGGGGQVLNPKTPYFGFDAAVDMELTCPATGFVVLDGFGGFHFGGAATAVTPRPPYFGFHIARDFEGIQ